MWMYMHFCAHLSHIKNMLNCCPMLFTSGIKSKMLVFKKTEKLQETCSHLPTNALKNIQIMNKY